MNELPLSSSQPNFEDWREIEEIKDQETFRPMIGHRKPFYPFIALLAARKKSLEGYSYPKLIEYEKLLE